MRGLRGGWWECPISLAFTSSSSAGRYAIGSTLRFTGLSGGTSLLISRLTAVIGLTFWARVILGSAFRLSC
jgi:hypothetical protein